MPTCAASRSRPSPARRSARTPTTSRCARFPGESAGLSDVLDELRTLPFLSKARVAVVEGADPFVTAHRRELEEYAEHPSPRACSCCPSSRGPRTRSSRRSSSGSGWRSTARPPRRKTCPMARRAWRRLAATWCLNPRRPRCWWIWSARRSACWPWSWRSCRSTWARRRRIRAGRRAGDGRARAGSRRSGTRSTRRRAARGRGALATLDSLFSANESPHEMLGAIRYSLLKTYHAGMLRKAQDGRQGGVPRGGHHGLRQRRRDDPPPACPPRARPGRAICPRCSSRPRWT